ncbi:hypothetical protein PWT90_03852 [Aphanocladium album]|nr:hypothetical protein PWT90_03852 [Aphanocladium album]
MSAAYKQFLASPSSSLLADNASLHYITTLSNFAGATEIIKHLTALRRQVTKKQEEILNVVEGQDAIAVEVLTALEFVTSGGVYLPKLDDNFLSDRTAYIPITHFVSFDTDGKIVQIRQQWDQGALLKQLEIVGKSGRNWPIQDSREQLRQIQSCLKIVGKSAQQTSSHNDVVIRTRHNSTNAVRDPHASLNLYGSREEIESVPMQATPNPYGGHRPNQRSVIDIIGDEPEEGESGHSRHRSVSPSKAGSGKNYQPSRIFDGQPEVVEEVETPKRGDKFIKPHPTKYNHFDFVDGSDPRDGPARGVDHDKRPKSKHDSQWSFDDFVTPAKATASKGMRSSDIQHWNPETQFSDDPEERHPAGKGRRDAETHFELQDDGERDARQERAGLPRGAMHGEGQSLYKNQLFDEVDPTPGPKRALQTVTNLKDRSKDFDPHFEMTDESPSQPSRSQHAPEGKVKMAKMMDHNWEVYEQSPLKENRRAPAPAATGSNQKIHIAGDGMGSRKGTTHDQSDTKIHIAGDGMGGRKGTSRAWMTGGDEDEEEQPKVNPRGRGTAAAQQTGGFWDF